MATSEKKLKVTLKRSIYGRLKAHRCCVAGLGLRRINSSAVLKDTPAIRGMVNKVSYLLEVEEV